MEKPAFDPLETTGVLLENLRMQLVAISHFSKELSHLKPQINLNLDVLHGLVTTFPNAFSPHAIEILKQTYTSLHGLYKQKKPSMTAFNMIAKTLENVAEEIKPIDEKNIVHIYGNFDHIKLSKILFQNINTAVGLYYLFRVYQDPSFENLAQLIKSTLKVLTTHMQFCFEDASLSKGYHEKSLEICENFKQKVKDLLKPDASEEELLQLSNLSMMALKNIAA